MLEIPFDLYEAVATTMGTPHVTVISIGLIIRTLVLLFMFERVISLKVYWKVNIDGEYK